MNCRDRHPRRFNDRRAGDVWITNFGDPVGALWASPSPLAHQGGHGKGTASIAPEGETDCVGARWFEDVLHTVGRPKPDANVLSDQRVIARHDQLQILLFRSSIRAVLLEALELGVVGPLSCLQTRSLADGRYVKITASTHLIAACTSSWCHDVSVLTSAGPCRCP